MDQFTEDKNHHKSSTPVIKKGMTKTVKDLNSTPQKESRSKEIDHLSVVDKSDR